MAKGDCFKAAGGQALNALGSPLSKVLKVVHGFVTGTEGSTKGKRFEHAWNEIGNVVFDHSNGKNLMMRREKYYDLGKIKKVKKYTVKEAVRIMATNGHYGPWESLP